MSGTEPFTWEAYHRVLGAALGDPTPEILRVPADRLADLAPERTAQLLRTLRSPGIYGCSKAERDLNYRHSVSFEVGLTRNVEILLRLGLVEPYTLDETYQAVVRVVGEQLEFE